MLLALVAAYAATTASSFGDATRSAGGAADKVYSKTLELNEQYDLLPKAKSAADAVTTAAVNIDRNYGARARRAPPLRIQRISARALPSARALLAEPPPRSLISLLRVACVFFLGCQRPPLESERQREVFLLSLADKSAC